MTYRKILKMHMISLSSQTKQKIITKKNILSSGTKRILVSFQLASTPVTSSLSPIPYLLEMKRKEYL
jgi:hypothetical protein